MKTREDILREIERLEKEKIKVERKAKKTGEKEYYDWAVINASKILALKWTLQETVL